MIRKGSFGVVLAVTALTMMGMSKAEPAHSESAAGAAVSETSVPMQSEGALSVSTKSIKILTAEEKAMADDCAVNSGPWAPPQSLEWVSASGGSPSDVVNLYVHGSVNTLVGAFVDAGWTQAFPRNIGTDVLYAVSVVLDIVPAAINWAAQEVQKLVLDLFHKKAKPVEIPNPVNYIIQRMPVAPETLCGKSTAFAFEMNNNPIGGRDHFRVYSLPQKDSQGRPVWAIAASRDVKIIFDITRPSSFFMNHQPQADEDFERDYVLDSLQSMKVILQVDPIQLKPTPVHPENGAFSGDDRVYDVILVN
jgi:hypothetical protein